jgi:hypothetical protein
MQMANAARKQQKQPATVALPAKVRLYCLP